MEPVILTWHATLQLTVRSQDYLDTFPIHLMVFSYKIVKLKDDLCQILLHKSFWNSDWFSILKISMSTVNDKSRRSISVSETHIFKVPVLEINNFWYLFTAIYIIIHVSAGTLPRSLFFSQAIFVTPIPHSDFHRNPSINCLQHIVYIIHRTSQYVFKNKRRWLKYFPTKNRMDFPTECFV